METRKLNVTRVRLMRLEGDECLKAMVEITLDNQLAVRGFKLIHDHGGRWFVAGPSTRTPSGAFLTPAEPVRRVLWGHIDRVVLDLYWRTVPGKPGAIGLGPVVEWQAAGLEDKFGSPSN